MDEFIKKKTKETIEKQIKNTFFSSISKNIDTVFEPQKWVFEKLNLNLYSNQTEIIDNILDTSINNLVILGARSSGKSFAVATGLAQFCLVNPKIRVLIYAPKAEQAYRLPEYIHSNIIAQKGPNSQYIDWEKTTKTRIFFKNGSILSAHSGALLARVESAHGDVLVIDEAQHLSDSKFSQSLAPMIASSKIGKTIKLGVPLFKGHFWKSFHNQEYKKLAYDWLHSPNLYNQGEITYENQKFPKYPVSLMPRSLKKQIFPNDPSLWTDGDMTEIDFRTQFMIEWVSDINLAFTERDQLILIDSNYKHLDREISGELYFFGLDFAGGEKIKESPERDYTALTVWRKTLEGKKELVYSQRWQGNTVNQLEEIVELIHPQRGVFKCKGGFADYGNMGTGYVDIMKNKCGIPIDGILFGARDSETGKNYKNAMYMHFLLELQNNKVKIPKINLKDEEVLVVNDNIKTIIELFHEISVYEKRPSSGVNYKLSAPFNVHDDLVSSAFLGVYAADTWGQGGAMQAYRIPRMILGPSLLNRGSIINLKKGSGGMFQ